MEQTLIPKSTPSHVVLTDFLEEIAKGTPTTKSGRNGKSAGRLGSHQAMGTMSAATTGQSNPIETAVMLTKHLNKDINKL